MPNVIKLRKGLDLRLAGEAAKHIEEEKHASIYAVQPTDFTGMTPKLAVKEGDHVLAGDALFFDKHHPTVKLVSPVSGTVGSIIRGERRKLLSVQITADAENEYRPFDTADPEKLSRDEIVERLSETGLLAFFRQRPYDVTVDPADQPRAIFVSAFSKMPLAADFSLVVADQMEDFQTGLTALSRISPVYLGISPEQAEGALARVKNAQITIFDGPNPSGNVGVHINHLSPIGKTQTVWTMGSEAVIFVGRLFNRGRVDLTRTIAIAGSEIEHPIYCKAKIGSPISQLTAGKLKNNGRHIRLISGNPLVGTHVTPDGFLGAFATELTAIPEGDDIHEMLGWIRPRLRQFSTNRSYWSWLMPKSKAYDLDARIKGGERHIIMSGEYDRVLPMDIYAGYLIKAILADDIDRMEALGIYEVAPEDFAVAEFVDSSKLELQKIVRDGLDMLRKEMA